MRENLSYTPEVQASTNHIYDQVKDVIPEDGMAYSCSVYSVNK